MATMTKANHGLAQRLQRDGLPVLVILLAVLVIWYLGAIWMNAAGAIERVLPSDAPWTWQQLVAATLGMDRPVLPAPHQVALDFWRSLVDWPVTSPRNLLFHVAVTAESTLWGFVMGTLLGLVLAVLIVHSRTLDRALLPWIVASQTVPVLAIAPIVLVILCFFPVTVAMVQGLRSPQKIETEMMHTYAASKWQALWLLRLPASLPFLFPALRVGIAAGLVGAMVAELPTGAVAGLGARLLTGSYYGNTIQIWSALVMSALLGLTLTAAVAGVERLVLSRRGGQA
jgi:NitT/TauT family transport system permease protein